MKINDIIVEDTVEDFANIENNNFNDDNYSKAVVRYKRKPVITLRHINKLKKMKAAKIEEFKKRQDLLQIMYGSNSPE